MEDNKKTGNDVVSESLERRILLKNETSSILSQELLQLLDCIVIIELFVMLIYYPVQIVLGAGMPYKIIIAL